jgi:hypothetical protein
MLYSTSMSSRDVFIGLDILVPQVDDMCSSDTILLFPEHMRFVPRTQLFVTSDLFLK